MALLVALIGGFLTVNNSVQGLARHRENRLASVQAQIENKIEALRQTVDGNLSDQNARMIAFEIRLTELEVRTEGKTGSTRGEDDS